MKKGNMEVKNIGTEKAWQRIRYYCAYQERSHAETRDKLYSFGLYKPEVENLLAQLIEENYLNEERFALAFAGGHFRTKQWGRVKIKFALSQKGVSVYSIKKALASIDEEEYESCLEKLATAKLAGLRSEKNIFAKKTKIQNFLLQKGFESDLVRALVNKLQTP